MMPFLKCSFVLPVKWNLKLAFRGGNIFSSTFKGVISSGFVGGNINFGGTGFLGGEILDWGIILIH